MLPRPTALILVHNTVMRTCEAGVGKAGLYPIYDGYQPASHGLGSRFRRHRNDQREGITVIIRLLKVLA